MQTTSPTLNGPTSQPKKKKKIPATALTQINYTLKQTN